MAISFEQIDQLQQRINAIRPLQGDNLRQIKEYYRIALTYTSNALEGNTLTESETKVILEDGLTVGGKTLREIYEATGHSKAYDFMFSLVTHKSITEDDIRQLHYLFYQQIDPQAAGQYRTQEVIITGSRYPVAAPSTIATEMQKLEQWMQKRSSYHPVEFAAELHRRFVYIHPFEDGNGRTARLMMNAALMQAGYEIAVIPPICRADYIHALEIGRKDPQKFTEFITEREWEAQKDMARFFHLSLQVAPPGLEP